MLLNKHKNNFWAMKGAWDRLDRRENKVKKYCWRNCHSAKILNSMAERCCTISIPGVPGFHFRPVLAATTNFEQRSRDGRHTWSQENLTEGLTIKGLVTQKHGTGCNWGRFCVRVEHRWGPHGLDFQLHTILCQCSSWKSGCMRESKTTMTSWWTTSRWLWVLGMKDCR